ncbi:MAG: right-handed parallel beta-helix repeat-containing protein [Clostridia bacterium]|nr:right-handed parallel beta-helix repeat-containing protein [Clostridia bacterium]
MQSSLYFLPPSGDKRDRSGEIEALLKEKGACTLGVGDYFVSGVTMPHGTSLFGMGEGTRVILLPHVTEGHAILLESHCTLRDLTVLGDEKDLPLPEVTPLEDGSMPPVPEPWELGARHGVGFLGDATNVETSHIQKKDCIVSGLRIRGFSGGGLHLRDTGYSTPCSLCASDCRIHACGAGIFISRFSEYNKFTGMVCTQNIYGCINNGGNNVFAACAFDANRQGFLIDNRENKSKNNAHGSCVGCTFNHMDHNTGIGVRILNSKPGFVFSGGQMFFSHVVLEDSQGIVFNGSEFGKHIRFHVTRGGGVTLSACFFSTQPLYFVEDNEAFRIFQCYTKGGTEIQVP